AATAPGTPETPADLGGKRSGITTDTLGGVCFTPMREGSPCDSNWSSLPAALAAGQQVFAPCEAGTVCVSPADVGWGSDTERRCMRTCEDAEGNGSHGYCACGVSECVPVSQPITDPVTGAQYGAHLCTPCDSN